MDICLYNNKAICAFDVTNINEVLNYEIAAEWREAGRKGLLRCPECGNEVHLRVKDLTKKVPHFAHKIKCNCSFGENTSGESEEHKKGKLKLYHYFRKLYEDAEISISKNFSNKRRADLYIEFKYGEKLAVEFQRTNIDKSEWKIRHDFYKENGIEDLWIINGHEAEVLENTKQISLSFLEQIMLNEDKKRAVYFDIENLKICLSKNIKYIDKHVTGNDSEILFSRSYDIEDIKIMPDGDIQCSFYDDYEKAAEKYLTYKERESLEIVRLQHEQLEKEKIFIENEQKKKEEIQKIRETSGEIIKNNN